MLKISFGVSFNSISIYGVLSFCQSFLVAQLVKICLQCRRPRFNPWVEKIPWRSEWQPTLVFLPGKSHGQRNLESCSSWGHKELDTTEQLTFFQSLGRGEYRQVGERRRLPTISPTTVLGNFFSTKL